MLMEAFVEGTVSDMATKKQTRNASTLLIQKDTTHRFPIDLKTTKQIFRSNLLNHIQIP